MQIWTRIALAGGKTVRGKASRMTRQVAVPASAAVAVARAGKTAAVPVGIDIRIQAVSAAADREEQEDRATQRVHGECSEPDCHLAAGSGLKAAKASPTKATTPAPTNSPLATVASV